MIDAINKLMDPIRRRIMLTIGRAVLTAINDKAPVQLVQATLLDDETRDGIERFQEYGFTSVPHPKCQAVSVFIGGERGHGVVIATNDSRYRVKGLEGGEVCIYTDEGDKITLRRGNVIEVETGELIVNASSSVELNAQTATINASQSAEVSSPSVTITGGQLTVRGAAAPSGSGPFCGITNCLFTGAPHVGDTVAGT